MTTHPAPEDILKALLQRETVLRVLADGAAAQSEVSEAVDASRPTVSRAVGTFEDLGVARRTENGYELTEFGSKLLARHDEYVEDVVELCQVATAVSAFPERLSFDAPIFDDPEVFFSQPRAPDSASYPHKGTIEQATRVRSALARVFSIFMRSHLEQMRDRGQRLELVVRPELAETLRTTYSESLEGMVETGQLTLYETSRRIPFTTTVVEAPETSYAILFVHSEGKVVGSLRNDDPAAVEWACSHLDWYVEAATEVTPA